MRKKIILFIAFICTINLYSQENFNIEELKISNIKNSDVLIINQGDTLIEETENSIIKPNLEIIFKAKNISDTTIILYSKDINFYISYKYRDKLYKRKLKFLVKKEDSYYMPDLINLGFNEDVLFYINTPVIELGSKLDIKTRNIQDFTMFLLETLPTLRFQYNNDATKSNIKDFMVKNVIIKDL